MIYINVDSVTWNYSFPMKTGSLNLKSCPVMDNSKKKKKKDIGMR